MLVAVGAAAGLKDGALVRLANPDETQQLVAATPVGLLPKPIEHGRPSDWLGHPANLCGYPLYMRDARGRYHEIGHVHQMSITSSLWDVTSFEGHIRTHMPGLREVAMSFKGHL